MTTKHRQEQVWNPAATIRQRVGYDNVVSCTVRTQSNVDRSDVGLRAEAVGQNSTVRQFRDDFLHNRMVEAQRGETIEWDIPDKLLERLAQRVEVSVVIEMLGVDIGDDCDCRRQSCKGAIAFIRL